MALEGVDALNVFLLKFVLLHRNLLKFRGETAHRWLRIRSESIKIRCGCVCVCPVLSCCSLGSAQPWEKRFRGFCEPFGPFQAPFKQLGEKEEKEEEISQMKRSLCCVLLLPQVFVSRFCALGHPPPFFLIFYSSPSSQPSGLKVIRKIKRTLGP